MAISNQDIPARIKLFRMLRGMTQEELSRASGIHYGLIRKYECGERIPKLEQLQLISDGLGISVNTLMDFDISTTGDVMSLLIKMDDVTGINFSADKNPDGTYDPSSVTLTFRNDRIREMITEYMSIRDRLRLKPDAVVISDDLSSPLLIEKTELMIEDIPL